MSEREIPRILASPPEGSRVRCAWNCRYRAWSWAVPIQSNPAGAVWQVKGYVKRLQLSSVSFKFAPQSIGHYAWIEGNSQSLTVIRRELTEVSLAPWALGDGFMADSTETLDKVTRADFAELVHFGKIYADNPS